MAKVWRFATRPTDLHYRALTRKLPNNTLLLPHRPASFPALTETLPLPLSGRLTPITDLHPATALPAAGTPAQGCYTLPPLPRWHPPPTPYLVALVERGGCNFAQKVLYAQSRGAGGVIVGDSKAYPSESDEEGRERRGLLTMFSPGSGES